MHVDFFIAGVQKGATTALDAFLRRHPSIQMAAVKEPHFFDNEALDWTAPDYDLLHHQYDDTPDLIRGEATPIYTYWRPSAPRLRAYNPAAKIIVLIRHPSFRAFSHWRMETTREAETLGFAQAIRAGRQRVDNAPQRQHRVFSYVERGFYGEQIERLLDHFPREQLHFARTDVLWTKCASELRAVCAFLNVAPPDETFAGPEYIVPLSSNDLGAPSRSDLWYLLDLFGEDIRKTTALTGIDLTDWLSLDYTEPMTPA